MADQEFGSPGEHMASRSNSSVNGGVAYRNPNNPTSNVSYSPPVYYHNANFDADKLADSISRSSARDRDADYFNSRYMSYNNDLFNSAMEYDKYMSNTAIQRQIADLKAAGLNPILATRLGGAAYHGVNAPYLSIAPASALNSYLDYESSMYSSNLTNATNREIANIHTKSNELISQFQECNKLLMQGNLFEHENEVIELQKCANEYLESIKHLNAVDLQKLGFDNSKALSEYQHNLNIDFYNLRFSKENFGQWSVKVGNLITGLSPFAALSQVNLPNFSNPVGFNS